MSRSWKSWCLLGLGLTLAGPLAACDADPADPNDSSSSDTDVAQSDETEAAETEATESEPAESEPAESEPAESEPAESEPTESEPTESEPVPPVMSSVTISPDPAYSRDTLTCSGVATHPDGADAITFVYAWHVNDGSVLGSGEDGEDLSPEAFDRDDDVSCTATPHVGELSGEPMTKKIVIGAYDLTIESGDGQTGTVAKSLASQLTVKVSGRDGVPDMLIDWEALDEGSDIESLTSTTDFSGLAGMSAVLGTKAGTYGFRASLAEDPSTYVIFSATAHADETAATIKFTKRSGDDQTGPVSEELDEPLVVELLDPYDNAISGASISWEALDGDESDVSASSTTTNASGLTQVYATPGQTTGVYTFRASLTDDASKQVTFSATAFVPVVGVAPGAWHTCAIRRDNREVMCWGSDLNDQINTRPMDLSFDAISGGWVFTCALRRDDGEVMCWGWDSPQVNDAPTGVSFDALSAGGAHVCAIRTDNRHLVCWGDNGSSKVSGAPSDVAINAVSAGGHHTCAIRQDNGELICWGSDSDRQVSDAPAGVSFDAVSAGGRHTCAIRSEDGEMVCWGDNASNKVSDTPSDVAFDAVSAGSAHTCGIRTLDGEVVCWGSDGARQISDAPSGVPVSVVDSHNGHICAIRTADDGLVCWGLDNYRQSSDAP